MYVGMTTLGSIARTAKVYMIGRGWEGSPGWVGGAFIHKTQGVAQLGRAPGSGLGGRRFESCHLDFTSLVVVVARMAPTHQAGVRFLQDVLCLFGCVNTTTAQATGKTLTDVPPAAANRFGADQRRGKPPSLTNDEQDTRPWC